MARRQSEQPTIREPLGRGKGLAPAIRSQSAYSYDYARPGYVERPRGGGSDYERLARSLAGLDKSLLSALERHMDRRIEEGVAQGAVLLDESDADNKNRQDWKAFTEAHPEHAGNNPWLRLGYEQARLKSLGLDFEKQLNDGFVQSGLINETDPAKIRDYVESRAKAFREEAGLSGYEDKMLLAQHFTTAEAQAKQRLYAKHSQYMQAQQETLTGQRYTDLAVKEMEALTDPAGGGVNMADPLQREHGITGVLNIVAARVRDATNHGCRNAEAPRLAANMLLTMYGRTHNPDFLEAMKTLEINGVSLISQPGMAEKVEALEYQRIQRQRAATQYAWAVEARAEQQREKALLGMAWNYSLSGAPLTPETLEQLDIPDRLKGQFARQVGEIYSGMQKVAQTSPAARTELALATLRAKQGEMSDAEAVAVFSRFGAEGKTILNTHLEAGKEENALLTSNMKDGANKVFSLFARTKEGLDLSFLTADDLSQLSQEQQDGLEAMRLFSARYEQEYRRIAAENKGNVSGPRAEALRVSVISDVTREMSEAFARRDAIRNAAPATSSGKTLPPPSAAAQTAPAPAAPQPLDPTAYAWVLHNIPGSKDLPADVTREELREAVQALAPDKLTDFDVLMR